LAPKVEDTAISRMPLFESLAEQTAVIAGVIEIVERVLVEELSVRPRGGLARLFPLLIGALRLDGRW
jgi:hypothetical protein